MQYLKCDEPDCDHVEYHEDITEDMIDKPCPKCGANLLTQKDYDWFEKVIKPVMELGDALNKMAKTHPELVEEDSDPVEMEYNTHNGEFTVKVRPINESRSS